MGKPKMKDRLLLIDANSLIHRAYHALPPLTRPGGEPSGALYGISSVLIKIFKDYPPTYAAAAFDRPEPTFRKEEFDEYKATRQPTPDDLITQIKESKNLLEKFGIKTFEKAGFEADDIIATLASKFANKKMQIEVFSGDLDTLQLVQDDMVIAQVPQKGISETKIYDPQAVQERFGVSPDQLADYKGLVGDSSDNFPGVQGIGPKTAKDLIQKYGSVEKIYSSIDEIEKEKPAVAKKLKEGEKDAFLSKKLAILIKDIPLDVSLEDLKTEDVLNDDDLVEYMQELGFKTLLKRISKAPEDPHSNVGKLF